MLYTLADQYQSVLADYLEQQSEGALERAYEFGRQVVASDLGVLELASLHQEALDSMLESSLTPEHRDRLARAGEFFLQALSPFEMVHRAMKEANLTLRRLHEAVEQHVLEEQLIQQELEFARQVQTSLLPTSIPHVAGFSFCQYYQPAREVGGDYFDYVRLSDRKLAIAIGDVAGKGVPAALLMARVSTEERYCLLTERTAGAALTRLNRQLTQSGDEDRFVTCALVVLDLDTNQATLANAGHLPPLLRRNGERGVEPLGTVEAGLPLGVAPEVPYEQVEFSFEPGDRVVLYTDGLTEARDPGREFYQIRRVAEKFGSGPGDVEGIVQAILEDLKRFVADGGLRDDLTLICFGREN